MRKILVRACWIAVFFLAAPVAAQVQAPPYAYLSLSPASSTYAPGQWITFKMTGGTPDNWYTSSNYLILEVSPTQSQPWAGVCNVQFQPATNKGFLTLDNGTSWTPPIPVGAGGQVVSNSQCSVDFSKASSSVTTTISSITVPIQFSASYVGVKYLYVDVDTPGGKWFGFGSTTIQAPEVISTPSTPTGPTSGSTGVSYSYTTGGSTSSLGNQVQYQFSWGDGTSSGWLSAGTSCGSNPSPCASASHIWSTANQYAVTAQARSATNTSVTSTSSPGLNVLIGVQPPSAVTLLTPANNAQNQSSVMFSWNAPSSGTATSYNIYLGTAYPLPFYANSTATNYTPPVPLSNSTAYYWYVVALNGSVASPPSQTYYFTTWGYPPAGVTLSAPVNGATGQAAQPTLSWTPTSANTSATSYDVYLGTNPQPPLFGNTGSAATSYTPGTPLSGSTTYYWNVVPRNGTLQAAASATWYFTTGATAPPAVTLSAPSSGSSVTSLMPTLSWTLPSGSNAASYQINLGTTSPPPSVASTGNTTTSYTPTAALTAGTIYYWSVTAVNSAGSTPSVVWSFTTPTSAPPPAVTLSAPSSGSTVTSLMPTLSWTLPAGSNASSYQINLGTTSPPPLAASTGTTTTSYTPTTALTAGTVYYWSVTAVNSGGSTPSQVWNFTTPGSAPPAVTLSAPSSGSIVTSLMPTLSWTLPAGSNASSYQINLGTSSPPPLAASTGTTTTSYTPTTALVAGTLYYWSVTAVSSAGSTPSAVWSFTTPAPSNPLTASLTPSSGNAYSQPFTATFTDTNGGADVAQAILYVLSNGAPGSAPGWDKNQCIVGVSPATNSLYVSVDAGGGWSTPVTAGGPGVASNSQCMIRGSGSTVAVSGNTVTVTLNVLLSRSKFSGTKQLYLGAVTSSGLSTYPFASWTVPTPCP